MTKRLILTGVAVIALFNITYSQLIEIPYSEFNLNCSFKIFSSKYTIQNRTDLRQLTDCPRLQVDFSEYSLIGVEGSIGGCKSPEIDFKIMKDPDNSQYIISATVFEYGNCRGNIPYRKTIITQKLESGFKIKFGVKNICITDY